MLTAAASTWNSKARSTLFETTALEVTPGKLMWSGPPPTSIRLLTTLTVPFGPPIDSCSIVITAVSRRQRDARIYRDVTGRGGSKVPVTRVFVVTAIGVLQSPKNAAGLTTTWARATPGRPQTRTAARRS